MKVILDPNCELRDFQRTPVPTATTQLASKIARKFDSTVDLVRSTMSASAGNVDTQMNQSFLYALSMAYKFHQKIAIHPHDLWYVMLTEVARMINANPDKYRALFTREATKVNIAVPTGSVDELPIELVIEKLREAVPVDVDLFIPEFSTHTDMSRLACLAAFADGVKSYYNYMTFLCGIPEIDIRGTYEDWDLFSVNLMKIAALFPEEEHEWFTGMAVRAVLIRDSLNDGATDFYKSIFTQENAGSGGELNVDGWFVREFFRSAVDSAKGEDYGKKRGTGGHKIENYPNTWSVVPFINLDTGRRFSDVYGCFLTTQDPDGFRVPSYGRFTFEHK